MRGRISRLVGHCVIGALCTVGAACKSWGQFWAPVISSVEPSFGATGDEIVIRGYQFASNAAENLVIFGSASAYAHEASAEQIKVRLPEGATSGKLKVTANDGTGESPAEFRVEKYFVYIVNNVGNIFGSACDNRTGAMTTVANVAAGTTNDLVVDPNGRYLYVTIGFSNGLRGYAISKAGQLSQLSASPYVPASGGTESSKVGMDGPGTAVYYYDIGSSTTFATRLDASSGNLTLPVDQALATNVREFVGDAAGNFLFGSGSTGIQGYNINATSKSLSNLAGSPFATTNQSYDIQFDARGKFLYAGRTIPSDVIRFNFDATSGSLTGLTTFVSPDGVNALAIAPNGNSLYTVDNGGPNIHMFPVDASGNLSTAVTTVAAGILPQVRITPNGKYLIAASTAGNLYVYSVATSGVLTAVAGSPFAGQSNPNRMRIAAVAQ